MAPQVSGVLLIAAFVVGACSALTTVPGLYAADTIDDQVALIGVHRSRWLVTQALVTGYTLLLAAGFVALAINLAPSPGGWLAIAGAVAVVAGTASGLYFVYLQTTDPRGGYSGRYPLPEVAAYWLWLAGLLLVGAALVVAGPTWLGMIAAGGAVLFAAYYLSSGKGFLTPAVVTVVGLLIGLVRFLR